MASDRLPSDARADSLIAIYRAAMLQLQLQLRAAIGRGALGTAAFKRQQIGNIRLILRVLERRSIAAKVAAVRGAYRDGAIIVDVELNPLERFAVNARGQFAGVHEAAVRRYVDKLDERLSLAVETVGRQIDDVFARITREQTAIGIAAGQTRKQVSAAIVEELVKEGTTAFVDSRGRRWSLDTYAAMAARTITREAVSQGTANRLLELGHDLITISEHVGSCLICLPYQGKTYSLTGASKRFEKIDRLPPFHPNCRHVVTPAAEFDRRGHRLPGRGGINAGAI